MFKLSFLGALVIRQLLLTLNGSMTVVAASFQCHILCEQAGNVASVASVAAN